MLLRVGCEFQYESFGPTPALILVEPHPDPSPDIVTAQWDLTPAMDHHLSRDSFRNTFQRTVIPEGFVTLRYDAVVRVSDDPDPVAPNAQQLPIQDLPDDVLVYTLASRYCHTEALSQVAWHLFGQTQPGWSRVQAICDWLNANIQYGKITSTPMTSSVDVYVAGGGMCRDFAHLAITFCRALNIPARYVFGYMPEFRPPEETTPMDFHAWFEVYLDDRWWTFDARFNEPLVGRIPIGIGRDAVDVAMVTTWGSAMFRQMIVWTEEVQGETRGPEDSVNAGSPGTISEGLVVEVGTPGQGQLAG